MNFSYGNKMGPIGSFPQRPQPTGQRPQYGNTFLAGMAKMNGSQPMQPTGQAWGDKGSNTFLGGWGQMRGQPAPMVAPQPVAAPQMQQTQQMDPRMTIAQLLMKRG